MKALRRSGLRVTLGKLFYTGRRYLEWYSGGVRFAMRREESWLPVINFSHRTPLLRRLKDVDMWLQYNKVTNLRLAAAAMDGLVIQPGETFSFWRCVGRPTRRRGFQAGMVLDHGGFRPGTGGGLCQLSNLVYWMALHTPLTVTERHRHSYDVFPDSKRTQPFGSGATCVFNYIDLRLRNDTSRPYQLHVWVDDAYLQGEWRCAEEPDYTYEVYEKEPRITHEPWIGYLRHNAIYRRVYGRERELVADEYVAENHALMMYPPFLPSGETGEKDGG